MTDTYQAIADAAESASLSRRVAACAGQQDADPDPSTWTYLHRYTWAASPGWGEAYAYAQDTGNPDPGGDPAVITDAMILAQVQSMVGGG